jgi:uncharacterized protein YcfJ
MTTTRTSMSPRGAGLAAAALSLAVLAGCAAPQRTTTVYTPQPVLAPVYTPPSAPQPVHDYRRRPNEALYEATVMSVRAVMGEPQQRCWIEREAIPQPNQRGVPGAVMGGIIGGILGHQIGGGSGRDVARIGGAVAGAAIGSGMATDRYPEGVATQDVQRCASVPGSAVPAYWDVTYVFQGITHRVQLTDPPGRSILVNARGEPRI